MRAIVSTKSHVIRWTALVAMAAVQQLTGMATSIGWRGPDRGVRLVRLDKSGVSDWYGWMRGQVGKADQERGVVLVIKAGLERGVKLLIKPGQDRDVRLVIKAGQDRGFIIVRLVRSRESDW